VLADGGGRYHGGVATGRPVTSEKQKSTAIVPIRIPVENPVELEDPRRSDVDEWGRSERTRALARALYDPLYSKWFRAEWEGLEKIPTEGGALLVANHAGAIPSDAPVIMHGIEKELERPVYGLADYFFRTVPVVGTLWARAGGVSARPANAYRLLKEQQQLALVFPEGTKGPSKSYTDRYHLRRFGRGGFVEIAMRAGVPVIPIAVIGSEEAMPIVMRLPSLAKAIGVPYFPITANLLTMGPLGVVLPFPAKFKLRVLDPVHFDVPADQDRYSKSRVMEEAEHIRTLLQESVFDMLRDRRSVWFG
jgi:1-acyl-sn-glycerol-3-phosphate acyltransferase